MSRWRFWRTLGRAVDPAADDLVETPVPPAPLPADRMRLHLFGANFPDAASAERFCYHMADRNTPEALTVELDGAFVDTGEVEVVHGRIVARLLDFLNEGDADDVMLRLGGDNTLIILTERAFGGLPYSLDDTRTLTYLGTQVVAV